MSNIKKYEITNLDGRIESGPIQFNDDWAGVFFRGDHALHYAFTLRQLLKSELAESIDAFTWMYLQALANELESCNQGG